MAKSNKSLTQKSNATEMNPLELLQKTCAKISELWEEESKVKQAIANCKAIVEDILDNHRDVILGGDKKVTCGNVLLGFKTVTKEKIDIERFKPQSILAAYPEVCDIKIKLAQVKAYLKNPQMRDTFEALGYTLEEKEEYDISKVKVINIS